MHVHFLKKVAITIFLFLISSQLIVEAKHPSSSCCSERSQLMTQFSGPVNRFDGGLYVVFTSLGTFGVNASTLDLTAAYNAEQIFPEADNFGKVLTNLKINEKIANNAVKQLKVYAVLAENYAIALNGGGDVTSALAAWNFQRQNLIRALHAIPHIKLKRIGHLVTQLQQAQLRGIHAYASQDFEQAILAREEGQHINNQIAAYFAKRFL